MDNTKLTENGAVFSFCLPNGDPEVLDDESSRDLGHQLGKFELTITASAEAFCVLLVDDSLINLKVLARMMTRLGIKDSRTCLNGCAAMETLKSIKDPNAFPNVSAGQTHDSVGVSAGPFSDTAISLLNEQLIISDLQMPDMDGYELIWHIREHSWFGEDPTVVACSADWTSETEHSCLSIGFDHVLHKPISFLELKHFFAFIAAMVEA